MEKKRSVFGRLAALALAAVLLCSLVLSGCVPSPPATRRRPVTSPSRRRRA